MISSVNPIEALYADHHGWLVAWLRGKLGCSHQAADLAQDTFLRVLLKRQEDLQKGLKSPRAYLTTIAHGLLVEHWRRRDLEHAWLATLAQLPEPQVPSPEVRLILLEALDRIDAMLSQLKPAVRSAFLWAQLEGASCPEIARRLGVSLATAERYVATALRHCYALRFEY
ncbi:MAG TPA: sigma-70 family RNA polymerase sigma factor [Bordetella sp.]